MLSGDQQLLEVAAAMGDAPAPRPLWPERSGQWFVLHVKPRQEKALLADLTARGIAAFLPLIEASRLYGHRKSTVRIPLFPGYLFLKGRRDDTFTADRGKRVVTILQVADQQELAWELASVQTMIDANVSVAAMRSIVAGTPVEVRTGRFKGFQGVVESLPNPKRLVVQVHFMQRALSLELDACQVEPLADA